jgi:riboflavin kinase/FMN adenylyltransferase
MEIIRGIDQLRRVFQNPVVTLGNFDGVHLGHQKIFKRIMEEASRIHGETIVITFDPHPLKILSPQRCPPLLTPFRKKMMLIELSGIKTVLCIEFSLPFADLSPPEFFKKILVEKVKARKIIVGYNYHFGKKQSGDTETLKELATPYQIGVELIEPLKIGDAIVSSSKIRELIRYGEVAEASKYLGRDYLVMGRVMEGFKRGHGLGFPTANLELSEELYPQGGVYAVEVVWKNQRLRGLANIGTNPTFFSTREGKAPSLSLEVHILNFEREIYGDEIQVHFKQRIRDEIRFESTSKLIDQIKKDVQWAKEKVFRD